MSRRGARRNRKLLFEGLEGRQMLAGVLNPSFEATPDLLGWSPVGTATPGVNGSFTVNRSNSADYRTNGVAGVVLSVDGTVGAFGTGFGRGLRSASFVAQAGDQIRADWRVVETGDDAIGRGFIVNAITGVPVATLFDSGTVNGSTPFVTATYTFPFSGTFVLDLQAGSFDATGGAAIGAELRVDNINFQPNLTLNSVATINENGTATLTGTIRDPDALDSFALNINWGDPLSLGNTQTVNFGPSPAINPVGNPSFESSPDLTGWIPVPGPIVGAVTVDRSNTAQSRTVGTAGALLSFSGTVGFGATGFGPLLRSGIFPADAGEVVSIDWRVVPTGDDAIGIGVIRDAGNNAIVAALFNNTGAPAASATNFQTASLQMPTSGNFYLEFQVGSCDASMGGLVGAELRLDNVQLAHSTGTQTFSITHQYLDDNPTGTTFDNYNIVAVLGDGRGGTSTKSTSVRVNNLAPSVTINPIAAANERGEVLVTGTISDPGTLDTFTLEVNWGDPSSPNNIQTISRGASATGSQTFSLTHIYNDDNPTGTPQDNYTITIKATDDDSLSGSASRSVTILDVAPSVVLNPVAAINENGIATLSGTVFDPGISDTFTVTINWGDPTSPNNVETFNLPASPTGSQPFTRTHVYVDDNPTNTPSDTYTIAVTAKDDDTLSGTTSTTVLVQDLPPTISGVTLTSMVNEGGTVTLTGTVADPGPLDTLKLNIDWGDPLSPGNLQTVTLGPAASENPVANPSFEAIPDLTSWSVMAGPIAGSVTVNRANDPAYRTAGVAGTVLSFSGAVGAGGTGFGPILQSAPFTANAGEQVKVDWRVVETEDDAIGKGEVWNADTNLLVATIFNSGAIDGSTAFQTATATLPSSGNFYLRFQVGSFDASGGTLIGAELRIDNVQLSHFTGQQMFSVTHTYLDDNPSGTSQDTYTVTVTAVDDDTLSGSATASTIVKNLPPTITSFVLPTPYLFPGQTANLSATGTDPGVLDTLTYTWNITQPDGTPLVVTGAMPSFLPAQEGIFNVQLVLSDDDLGQDTRTGSFIVASTLVELVGLDLHVLDIMPGGKEDNLRISFDAGTNEIVVADPDHAIVIESVPGATGHGTKTVRVPLAAFAGQIIVDTLNGNDAVQLQALPRAAVVNGGAGDDALTVISSSQSVTLNGEAGADVFSIGSTQTANNGNLDLIAGPIVVNGGANPVDSLDTIYVNDRLKAASSGYLVTPTSITSQPHPSDPGATRPFAGITYDGTVEYVRLDGTDLADCLEVQPSLDTEFYIDGNLPAPGTVVPDQGDFLKLDTETTGTTGRKLEIFSPGSGRWTFTSAHKPVNFESIEKFNHVDILLIAADAGATSLPLIRVYDAETHKFRFQFRAFESSYNGGVRVAAADIDNDGLSDIVAVPGRGRPPDIRVFNGSPQVGVQGRLIPALRVLGGHTYGAKFVDGLNVAVGDVNGDGANDIVVVPTRGASTVKVFENQSLAGAGLVQTRSFNAFADKSGFIGGAALAVADLDGTTDGNARADILVGSGAGIAAVVRVFDVSVNNTSYNAIRQIADPDVLFRGGVMLTTGDVNGDGRPDIITAAGPLGKSTVRVYNAVPSATNAPLKSFAAYTASSENPAAPIRVVARDIDGDGDSEIYVAQGPDGRSNYRIKVFDPLSAQLVDQFFAAQGGFSGGGVYLG